MTEIDLLTAVEAGDLDRVRAIIAQGADLDVLDEHDRTPVMLAYVYEHPEVARELLDAGASRAGVSSGNAIGLMGFALYSGERADIERLLADGLDFDFRTRDNRTAAHFVVDNPHPDVVSFVISERFEDLAVVSDEGLRPLDFLGDTELWDRFVDAHPEVPIDIAQPGGATSMHIHAHLGHAGVIRSMLRRGAGPSALDEDKQTPLHWAAHCGHTEVVTALIEVGADVDARNAMRATAVDLAVLARSLSTVTVLLDAGAHAQWPRRAPSEDNTTPLMDAAGNGDLEIVQVLLAHGAPVNTTTVTLRATALSHAALRDHPEVIEVLLAAGAAPNGINRSKDKADVAFIYSPLGCSRSARTVDLLVAAGAEVNAFNAWRETALIDVADSNHACAPEVVAALLRHGADPRAVDQNGRTAIERSEQAEVVRLLAAAMKLGDGHRIVPVTDATILAAQEGYDGYHRRSSESVSAAYTPDIALVDDLEIAARAMYQRAREAYEVDQLEALDALLDEYPEAAALPAPTASDDREGSLAVLLYELMRDDAEDDGAPDFDRRLEVVQHAIDAGASPEARGATWNETALHSLARRAARTMSPEYAAYVTRMVEILIAGGGSLQSKDSDGATPADLATSTTLRQILLGQAPGELPEDAVLTPRAEALQLDALFAKCSAAMGRGDLDRAGGYLGDIERILPTLPETEFITQWAYYYSFARYVLYEVGQQEKAFEVCRRTLEHLGSVEDWPYLADHNIVREAQRSAHNMLAWDLVAHHRDDLGSVAAAVEHMDQCFATVSPIEHHALDQYLDTRVAVYSRAFRLDPATYGEGYTQVLRDYEERYGGVTEFPEPFEDVIADLEILRAGGSLSE